MAVGGGFVRWKSDQVGSSLGFGPFGLSQSVGANPTDIIPSLFPTIFPSIFGEDHEFSNYI